MLVLCVSCMFPFFVLFLALLPDLQFQVSGFRFDSCLGWWPTARCSCFRSREVSSQQPKKRRCLHRHQPPSKIPLVRDHGNFPRPLCTLHSAVPPGLFHGRLDVQPLHRLHLPVEPRQHIADHVRRLCAARKLLPAPRGVAVLPELVPPLPLAALALVSGFHLTPRHSPSAFPISDF